MVGHPTVKCRDIMEKIQELLNKSEIKYKATTAEKAPAANAMTVSHSASSLKIEDKEKEDDEQGKGMEPKEEKLKEKQLDGNKVLEYKNKRKEVMSSLAKEEKVNSPTPTPKNEVDQMTIIKKLRKLPELVHMYDALHFSPTARFTVEQALSEFAMRNGEDNFFMNSSGIKDYITDVEHLGRPLPVLTRVNKEQRARTDPSWPNANDTLPMPASIITFSNDDLCHPEPNHNRPLFVSVEHRNKLVRRALIDQGSSINILPLHVLFELGYTKENLMPDDTTVNSVSPVPCESLGTVCLHISVGPFSLPHKFCILEVNPMWHMLLGRPWIHDHRCVPSSWYQCIKSAPSKGGQIRVWGLRNPFALEEAHFADAAFFMEGNGP